MSDVYWKRVNEPFAYVGITIREYAAIQLRVPNSGLPWLDDMIRKSIPNLCPAGCGEPVHPIGEACKVGRARTVE